MKTETSYIVLLLLLVKISESAHVLPIVRIDLDTAPETRWIAAL